jgi:polyadenylate-binding protein
MISQEKTMLYLTDLPFGISIQDVQDFLSSYADKIRYINPDQNPRNKDNRKPLAIKVLFKDNESANKCRLEMNLKKLRGKSVRIMWDERDTTIRYNTKNNLFIKGIPKKTTPREVYEYFLQFGDISSCKINEDENGNHKGYGYITYYKGEDAQKAIDETKDKKIFDTNNIEITHFQKKNERIINSNDNQKIYIKNLPDKYSVNELTKLCSEYGKVENCNIYSDNLCKDFGIVQFSSESEAKEAIEKLNGKEINGNKLMTMFFQTKSEHKQYLLNSTKRINEQNANCNLYIKNIPLTAKEEDLSKIFSKYGNVISVRIEKSKIEKKDEKGKFDLVSKGFGFLSFDNPESARKAIEDLNGRYLPGFEAWNRTLIIEFFLTKYERQYIENQDVNYANYFMNKNNNQNTPMNYMGAYQYPFSYPYNYPLPANQRYPPMPFNQFNTYGFKKNWRGGNRNNRNNNYRGNNNYKKNINREQKKEETEEKNKNAIDLSEYYKLENADDKKDFLGEKIFKAIEESPIASERKVDIETIGKITGMIIELPDQKEIIEILENPDILNNRIEEALNLLEGKVQ